jgi:ATP-dependent DNA helicase RecQ
VDWHPDPKPTWITWVPSLNHTTLVPDLARRLGVALGLPAVDAFVKTKNTRPQKNMENSAQQLANIKGAFAVNEPLPHGPVLLVDDIVDSRWTLSYLGSVLLSVGCESVMPVALSDSGHS